MPILPGVCVTPQSLPSPADTVSLTRHALGPPFVAGSVKLQLKSPDMRLFRRRRPPPILQKTNDLLWLDRSWQRVRAGPAFTGRQALREVIETSVSLRIQLAVRLFPQNLCPHLPRPSRERYPNILSGEHLRFGSGCKISRGMDKFGSGPTNSATNLRSLPKELLPCRPA